VYEPPSPSTTNPQHLNFRNEADRLKTYETWSKPFMDANQLAAAGFYFINQ